MKNLLLLLLLLFFTSNLMAQMPMGTKATDAEIIKSRVDAVKKSIDTLSVEQYEQLIKITTEMAKNYPLNLFFVPETSKEYQKFIKNEKLRDSLFSTVLTSKQMEQFRIFEKKRMEKTKKFLEELNGKKTKK